MNQIETKHVVAELAEHFIVSGHRNKTALNGADGHQFLTLRDGCYAIYFRISFDMLNYGYEKNGSTHHKEWDKRYQRTIHILVTQRHQVFVAVTHPREDVEISNWVNSSNHDSCWKSDGLNIFEKVAWDAYEHCFAFMPDEHRPAPIAAHTFTQFADWHFGRLPFEIVKVKGKYGGDYRNFLTEIKKVDYQINILDPEVHTENDNEIL